mgnify:CR=1 FL=1
MNYDYHKYSYRTQKRRKLRRSRDGVIWGVCKGLADWIEAPVGFVRITYLVLLIATGFFPLGLAYILAAIFIPLEDSLWD